MLLGVRAEIGFTTKLRLGGSDVVPVRQTGVLSSLDFSFRPSGDLWPLWLILCAVDSVDGQG